MTFDELQAEYSSRQQALSASQAALCVQLHQNNALQVENKNLQTNNCDLQARNDALQQQLDWFKRQLFGPKSERRELNPDQLALFQSLVGDTPPDEPEPKTPVPAHSRKTQRSGKEVNDQGLRFDDDVPVETITLSHALLQGESADQYEVIAWKEGRRLASVPGTTVVLCYRRPVFKRKGTDEITSTPAPEGPLGHAQVDAERVNLFWTTCFKVNVDFVRFFPLLH